MGQCASNKAKGNLSVKKILTQKKLKKKMDKNKQSKDSEDNNKTNPMSSDEKKPQKYTKGTAMSFGFKRRPTPMITSTSTVAWESDGTRPDPNGNKDNLPTNSSKTLMHKTTPTSSQKHISSITPKPSRFNFSQTNTERTNKVADIKNPPPTVQLSATLNRTGNKQVSLSGTELNSATAFRPNSDLNRACTRNVTIITRTQVTETSRTNNDDRGINQTGKFMFQTTRLPQPEPIRVIETKTAKTIANNNRRSARMWRQYEDTKPLYEDSGFGSSSASGGVENRLQDCNRFTFMENSDSFSDACTPPPLPELPSVFDIEKQDNDNKEEISSPYNTTCKKNFLKSSPDTFLKNRRKNMLDSPQSSSDQEWLYGGEAMADDLSLSLSPKIKLEEPKSTQAKSRSMTDSLLENILKPAMSLEMIDSLKESMSLSLCVEDANFSALVTNNNTVTLLDDEILSPVESLLSSSDTEEVAKNKNNSSSNSKDVNEKLTPPGSPSNATYSLSLSDDKEDFLIDDEIADQPELLFEEGNNQRGSELDSASISRRQTSYASDFSPLKKQRNSIQNARRGSFDSLSPCDSIGSEDLMCDYDVSQSNDLDVWDRQSGSYTSLEGTPKTKFKLDDSPFNNKNFFRNLTPKHSNSPSSLKLSYKSSPEHRSPKRSHFSPFGYQSSSESLALTKANHAAMQHDIIGIRTMLLTLKRVLNESESCTDESFSFNNNHNNNNNEFKLELADLRRQVIFLQGQLEDKEKTVTHLQRQIGQLAIQNTHSLDNAPLLAVDIQNRCNAATQTERARPISSGMFSLTTTPIEDNNPILRYMVK